MTSKLEPKHGLKATHFGFFTSMVLKKTFNIDTRKLVWFHFSSVNRYTNLKNLQHKEPFKNLFNLQRIT